MQILKIGTIMFIAAFVAGCEGQSPTERALMGGLAGAVVADATNNDVLTTAVLGAGAGALSCGIPGFPPCN